jgi:hypothetical protein
MSKNNSTNNFEFKRLEQFVNYLSKQSSNYNNANEETIVGFLKFNFLRLFRLRYFEFIPKDSTFKSKEIYKLVMDLKCIEKTYNLKSYIIGFNFLYFALLFDKKRNIFSTKMLSILFGTSLIIFLQQYYFYDKIFNALDPILSKDIIYLYESLKMEREGVGKEVVFINFRPSMR